MFRGIHTCGCRRFPRKQAGAYDGRVEPGNPTGRVGWLNLFVPGKRCVYVAPELIMHYIRVHEYCPPKKFQDAVLACPKMLSADNLRAIEKKGPRALAEKATARIKSEWLAKLVVETLVDEKLVQKEHTEPVTRLIAEQFGE